MPACDAPLAVHDRVPEDAEEPGQESLVLTQVGRGPQGAEETVVDDVFGQLGFVDPVTDVRDEALPAGVKVLNPENVGPRLHHLPRPHAGGSELIVPRITAVWLGSPGHRAVRPGKCVRSVARRG